MNRGRLTVLKAYLMLGKPQITFPVTLSALTGYLLFKGQFAGGWLPGLAGVFLMSFASSAINQVQEAGIDSLMERTRNRPIPSGSVSRTHAMILAMYAAIAGFWLLAHFNESSLPALLSLITLACYNLLYTPLKRLTSFAVFPGALVGALPPLIGWTAAGGPLWHPHILLVGFFFFVGQIPHFWLILLKYDREYAAAGLPTLTQIFSLRQIRHMTLGWVAGTAMAGMLLLIAGVIQGFVPSVLMVVYTMAMLATFRSWLSTSRIPKPDKGFMALNVYYLLMMLTIMADAISESVR